MGHPLDLDEGLGDIQSTRIDGHQQILEEPVPTKVHEVRMVVQVSGNLCIDLLAVQVVQLLRARKFSRDEDLRFTLGAIQPVTSLQSEAEDE